MDSEVQVDEMETAYFRCDCGSEVLAISYDEPFGDFEVSIFEFPGDRGWKHKFRQIRRILKYGTPYGDQLCFGKTSKELKRMVSFIQKRLNDNDV